VFLIEFYDNVFKTKKNSSKVKITFETFLHPTYWRVRCTPMYRQRHLFSLQNIRQAPH